MSTRVLVLGGRGMLGRELVAHAPASLEIHAPARDEVDVGDEDAVSRFIRHLRPAYVVNAAAYTGVDAAEERGDEAARVNAEGPGFVGAASAAAGATVLHFSTDYVFAGDATRPYGESDRTAPLNRYGATKLAGEEALIRSGGPSLVVRTSWLYGRHGRSFPRTMLERALAGSPTRVIADQAGRPSSAVDVARASWRMLTGGAVGVVHVSSGGPPTTWFGIAERIFDRVGRRGLLMPCTTEEFPTLARRPAYSVLDNRRAEELLGAPLPDWRGSLDGFIEGLLAEAATKPPAS